MATTLGTTLRQTPAERLRALVGELAGESGSGLSAQDRLDFLTAAEQVKGAVCAAQARVTTAFIDARDAARAADVAAAAATGDSFERATAERFARRAASSDRAEVALARRENPTRGDRHVGLAKALVRELPETMALLTLGRISEETAMAVCAGTATLTLLDRRLADARLAPDLASLTARQARKAADRVTAELDAAAVVRAKERAAKARRVTVRPAPGGMAYLTVLGPLADMVSAFAALGRDADTILAGHGDQDPAGRSKTQVMADLAAQRLTGLAPGEPVPMEIVLVMPAGALFDPDTIHTPTPGRAGHNGTSFFRTPSDAGDGPLDNGTGGGDDGGSDPDDLWDGLRGRDWGRPDAPTEVVGFGPVPSRLVRDWLRTGTHPDDDAPAARVWLRRLFTSPDGRDLVALDSVRRFFTGGLRRFVMLRDQDCSMPFCDAPGRHVDHTTPVADGGPTTAADGVWDCARQNLDKEAGWQVTVTADGLTGHGPHTITVTTPAGQTHTTHAPPVTGTGTMHPPPGSAWFHDDDQTMLARWQHHVDQGRPLDRDEQLRYDHLIDIYDSDPPYLDPSELADF